MTPEPLLLALAQESTVDLSLKWSTIVGAMGLLFTALGAAVSGVVSLWRFGRLILVLQKNSEALDKRNQALAGSLDAFRHEVRSEMHSIGGKLDSLAVTKADLREMRAELRARMDAVEHRLERVENGVNGR